MTFFVPYSNNADRIKCALCCLITKSVDNVTPLLVDARERHSLWKEFCSCIFIICNSRMYITFFQVKFKCFALNLGLFGFFVSFKEGKNACLVAEAHSHRAVLLIHCRWAGCQSQLGGVVTLPPCCCWGHLWGFCLLRGLNQEPSASQSRPSCADSYLMSALTHSEAKVLCHN